VVEVKTKQQLKAAILSGADEIKVDNPKLEKWIIIIHGIKQCAWAVAIVLIAGGITAAIIITAGSGGAGAPAGAASLFGTIGAASTVVGLPAAIAMASLGVALGGVNGLKAIREKYQIKSKTKGNLVLSRKAKEKAELM